MEINKRYGKVFKALRRQRNLKLTAFESTGISPATISNFENGKTMISFEKLRALLSILSVSLCEYLTYTEGCTSKPLSHDKQLLLKIKNSIINDTYSDFDSYQLEALKLQEYFLYLSLKGTQTSLDLDEIGELSEYFDQIEHWRMTDLYTLYLSINRLKPRQSSYILEGFFMEEEGYSYSYIHESCIFQITFHTICCLISKNHSESAKHFINYLYSRYLSHTMYTRNSLNFIEGLWIAKFKDEIVGRNQLNDALNIFEQLEDPEIVSYYKRLYDKFLND